MTPSKRLPLTTAIAALSVLATASAGFARPDARAMTCGQTQALIEQQRAVVITTGRHTYERFVAYNGYCYHPEVPRITFISTRDNNRCPVYHCERPVRFFDD